MLKIIIEGGPKSGKTTVLGIIRKALLDAKCATDVPGKEVNELMERERLGLSPDLHGTLIQLETRNPNPDLIDTDPIVPAYAGR